MSQENKYYQHEMKLMEKVREAKRICNYPGCTQVAINSHILQENGILNRIADEKKIVMEHTRWSKFRPEGFYPASISKSKMFTFKGFCDDHDGSVFKEIEDGGLDFNSYKHKLLFSYRGLLNDLYGAVLSRDFANKALHDKMLPEVWKPDYIERRNREQLKINELTHYKWVIEREIIHKEPSQQFFFHHFSLPKLEVATSTIYGGIEINGIKSFHDLDYSALRKLKTDNDSYKPLTHPIFINLIPGQNELSFILGHIKTRTEIETIPVNEIGKLKEVEILNLLSKMLPKLEVWAMSNELYKKWQAEGKIEHLLSERNGWMEIRPFFSEADLEAIRKSDQLKPISLLT